MRSASRTARSALDGRADEEVGPSVNLNAHLPADGAREHGHAADDGGDKCLDRRESERPPGRLKPLTRWGPCKAFVRPEAVPDSRQAGKEVREVLQEEGGLRDDV